MSDLMTEHPDLFAVVPAGCTVQFRLRREDAEMIAGVFRVGAGGEDGIPTEVVQYVPATRLAAAEAERDAAMAAAEERVQFNHAHAVKVAQSITAERDALRDLLREARDVLGVIRGADMLRGHAYDTNENGRSTSDDLNDVCARIDAAIGGCDE